MAILRSKNKKNNIELPKRPSATASFTDKSEFELIKELFIKDKLQECNIESAENIEEVKKEAHSKRSDRQWDVTIEDEIEYFDPTLTYELTGYRPLTETEGLDFDPGPFREVGEIYQRTGHYTAYRKNTKPFVDF